MRILLVEDSTSHAGLFRYALEDLGIEEKITLVWAQNAPEARLKLEEIPFNLMIVDIGIPGENGIEFTNFVKKSHHSNIPVLILSMSQNHWEIQRAYEAGANAYLYKPSDFDNFLNDLSQAIRYFSEIMLHIS
ncbi:MAG: response regulator [Bacteroidia bacterium]|nr:response regulator [Bacteroidia bacterium]